MFNAVLVEIDKLPNISHLSFFIKWTQFFIKSAKNGSFFINTNILINGRIYTPDQRSLVDIGEEDSRVQRRRKGAAVVEIGGDELDQESLDWLARRRLMRENTRKSGTASSISKGSHALIKNITTPEDRRRKPEVIVVEDNMASTKTNTSKR